MRALLVWPELPVSFWSFPKACELRGCKTSMPPLGLITVAALLPDHWELRLVDLCVRPLREEDWRWADMVMISGMYLQKAGLLAIVREAKRRGKTVVAGGPYATTMPHELLEGGCDYVVRGEAENTIQRLLDALEAKNPGVIENGERPEMSISPIPRFDLLNFHDYSMMAIQTSRGCPFDCEFCDVVRLLGRKVRCKSPEQVIAELDSLSKLGYRGNMFICDDNLIGSKTHARALLKQLIPWAESVGKPFSYIAQVSLNLGKDPELIDLLTEACVGDVFIGIESPDEEVLRTSHKFQNLSDPIVESVNTMKKNGIWVIGSFIIGLDGEKKGAGQRICALVEQTEMPLIMLGLLQAPPDTNLWNRLKKEGRLREDVDLGGGTYSALNFHPDRPEKEILEEFYDAWSELYSPERYLERVYHYYLSMRPTREALALSRGEPSPYAHVPKLKRSLRTRYLELLAILKILWWYGLRMPCRRQFWAQLIGMAKRNPSRIKKYVIACAMGYDLFDVRETVMREASEIARARGLGDISSR